MIFSSQSPQENGELPEDSITITDELGRQLNCVVQSTLDVDGQEYLLLLPVDAPAVILTWPDADDDEEAIPVESEDQLNLLFPIARAVLAEQNLTLQQTAVTLTIAGELPDPDEDDDLDSRVDLDDDEDYEELMWLTSFYHQEQEYGIYVCLDPFLILARLNDEGEPQLLTPAELEKLKPLLPMIEDQLFDDLA